MFIHKTLLTLFLVATLLFPACQKAPQIDPAAKAAAEVERIAAILESPDRQRWQMPERVIAELKLKNGNVVADIGAGTGYFARRFAEKVAPNGLSIGYDINPAMVEFMQRDSNARNLVKNYKAHLIPSRTPLLEANFYDVIFLCNTYQYIENRSTYFKSLAGSLKKNGRIVVIDFTKLEKADEESGEVPENLVDKEIVKREFKTAGLRLKRDMKFLPAQYFLEFARE